MTVRERNRSSAQTNQPVAICLPRSVEQIIGLVAILNAGAGYLPLDEMQPAQRCFDLLHESQVKILLTSSALASRFEAFNGTVILIDVPPPCPVPTALQASTPHDLAYIIYTSGSTGKPKGVLLEHQSVVRYCRWFFDYSQTDSHHRIDFSGHYIFDMAVTTAIAPLLCGASVVICPEAVKKDPRAYLQYLREQRIHLLKITPSYFRALLRELEDDTIALPDLKNHHPGGRKPAYA